MPDPRFPFTPGTAREVGDPAVEMARLANIRRGLRLAQLAKAQRDNAAQLLAEVREASEAGMSWREIGEALGIDQSIAFRYVKAGSPVSVLRPFLSEDSPRASTTEALGQ